MVIEVFQQILKGICFQLCTLLVKGRTGRGICIEMKSFEKFMIYVSTFHGKQKGCCLAESHFTIPGKILIRIVYKAGKIIGHFKNNVIESRFNSFRKIHYVYLLELESKYSSNNKWLLSLKKIARAAAHFFGCVKYFL